MKLRKVLSRGFADKAKEKVSLPEHGALHGDVVGVAGSYGRAERLSGIVERPAFCDAPAGNERPSQPRFAPGAVRSDTERAVTSRPEADEATTLVVVEAGALWPGWIKELQARAPNSVVEVKPTTESLDSFATRVLRRLTSLRQRGVDLLGVVYAAAAVASSEERKARRNLCATLIENLSPTGELVLSGTGWSAWGAEAEARADLLGLAGDLSCELTGRTQTVSVRFSDPLEESGVHKAPRLTLQSLEGRSFEGGVALEGGEGSAGAHPGARESA